MPTGVVLGKFMPLHLGSLMVCSVASSLSEKLLVVVLSNTKDQISASVRTSWLKSELPQATVKILEIETARPSSNNLKKYLSKIKKLLPAGEIKFFGSENYVFEIARIMKKKYIILDPARLAICLNSSDILKKPFKNWYNLPVSVRKSLQKRVTLIGPESVGKSTLAKTLATEFSSSPFVPEYGRPYEEYRSFGQYLPEEFETIAKVHAAHRSALSLIAGPVLIEDTDELITSVWAEMLLGKKIDKIEALIAKPDLYLLLYPSVPFTKEPIRYFSDRKQQMKFFHKIRQKVLQNSANYKTLYGSWEDRKIKAIKKVKSLLNEKNAWRNID